jgi:hypothetical protein
MYETRLRGET